MSGWEAAYMRHLELVDELFIGLWLAAVPKLAQRPAVTQLYLITRCLSCYKAFAIGRWCAWHCDQHKRR